MTQNNTKEIILQPSTLENIDAAVYEYFNEQLDIFSTTKDGFKKVPVIFATPERSVLSKKEGVRDGEGALIFPQIAIERVAVNKSKTNKGAFGANFFPTPDKKRGTITYTRRVNQRKTADRAIAQSYNETYGKYPGDDAIYGTVDDPAVPIGDPYGPVKNNRVVYETITIPHPVMLELSYSIKTRTEYAQQMNEIVTPMLARIGNFHSFYVIRNGHRYEAFFEESFNLNNNVSDMGTEERKFETEAKITVLGYIFGEDKNEEAPKVVIREGAAEFKISREKVIVGDNPDTDDPSLVSYVE